MARAGPNCQVSDLGAASAPAAAIGDLSKKTCQRKCGADEFAARPGKAPRGRWPDCSCRKHNSSLSTCHTNRRRWNYVALGGYAERGSGGIPGASGRIPDLVRCPEIEADEARRMVPNHPRGRDAHCHEGEYQPHPVAPPTAGRTPPPPPWPPAGGGGGGFSLLSPPLSPPPPRGGRGVGGEEYLFLHG